MGNCSSAPSDFERQEDGSDGVKYKKQYSSLKQMRVQQENDDNQQPVQETYYENNMSSAPVFIQQKYRLENEVQEGEYGKQDRKGSDHEHEIGDAKIVDIIKQWSEKYEQQYKQFLEFERSQSNVWTDQEYPAVMESLTDYPDKYPKGRQYSWLRPSDIQGFEDNYTVFCEGITPQDIKQGALGDCYLLSSLAALAENADQQLINRLFEFKERKENGIYGIWLCIFGEWQLIKIDNLFPCNQYRKPAYSKANGAELWVLLIEKAYAKVYGTYKRIEAGLTGNALRDLTGAPYTYVQNDDPAKTWSMLEQYDDNINILTAGSQSNPKGTEYQEDNGIISGHAYSILDHQEVTNSRGEKCRIIKLRNPWGQHEWNGRFSDNSDEWTPELKVELNVTKKNDGIFWMPIEDFCKTYAETTVNFIHHKSLYSSYKIQTGGAKIYQVDFTVNGSVEIKSKVKNYISITQKSDRWFEDANGMTDYQYSLVRLMVFKKNGDDFQFLGDNFKSDRDIDVAISKQGFTPGEYIAVVEIDWTQSKYCNDFVISSYGPADITFTQHTEINQEQFELFVDIAIPQKTTISNYYQYRDGYDLYRNRSTLAGYLYFNYINYTSNLVLQETGFMKNRQYLEICAPNNNPDQYDIEVNPGESQVVKYRIGEEAYGGYGFGMRYSTGIGRTGFGC